MNNQRNSSERGAVAVLSAVLAVVLFGIGAIVIDLGQAWSNKALLQTSVDVSVMAAAAELDQASGCNTEVHDTAKEYLNTRVENQVAGQYPIDLSGPRGDGDGSLVCPPQWRVELEAPASKVEYGLAAVLGVEDTHVDVAAFAAAELQSPKMGVWPVYAVAGCDMGPQTLIDPASGLSSPTPPVLSPASGTANQPRLNKAEDPDTEPTSTPLGSAATLTISGSQLDGVTKVGFTRESAPVDVGGHQEVVLASPNGSNSTITGVALPSSVYSTEAVWWVRVFKGGVWSSAETARAYVVGEPVLRCEGGSTTGNFGVVNVPNSAGGGTWEETGLNIASGLEYALQTYPSAPSAPSPCAGLGDAVTVDSTSPGGDPVNCLTTQSTTGIATNAVTAGLVTGVNGEPGLLDVDPTPLCGGTRWTPPSSGGTSYPAINDDRLECFLTAGATISQITASTLPTSLEGVLAPEILDSPRFFWVPVFSVDPGPGGSSSYAIQDFRPAFLTGVDTATSHNGMEFAPSGVVKLEVVFFHEKALPQTVDPTRETMDYLGVGPKIIRMVD